MCFKHKATIVLAHINLKFYFAKVSIKIFNKDFSFYSLNSFFIKIFKKNLVFSQKFKKKISNIKSPRPKPFLTRRQISNKKNKDFKM